jgi:hypothetical protein
MHPNDMEKTSFHMQQGLFEFLVTVWIDEC